jgi:hypothetical protein
MTKYGIRRKHENRSRSCGELQPLAGFDVEMSFRFRI